MNPPNAVSRCVAIAVIASAISFSSFGDQIWKGTTDNQWTTTGNWNGNAIPGSGDFVIYNNLSTANLSNWLSQAFSIKGIQVSNVASAVSINSASTLTVGASGITNGAQSLLIAAPIALGANQTWGVANSQTLSSSGPISGTTWLFKDGFGALYLSGTNTFTGNFTNNGGPVWINNSNSLGVGPKTISVANNLLGAGLHLNGTNGGINLAANLSFTISQNQGVIFNDAGTNVINGPMSVFSGGGNPFIVANDGLLTLNGTISLGTTARPLQLGGPGMGIVNGQITGSGMALRKTDAGSWTFTNNDTFSGVTTVEGGALVLAPTAKIGSTPSITVFTNSILDVSAVITSTTNAFALTANQVLAGSGTVTGNVATSGGSLIQPGGTNAIGTLSFANNLTMGSTATNMFELNNPVTPGGGTNDLVNVGGNLDPQSARIRIMPVSALTSGGSYRLFNYTGTKPSSFNSTILTDARYGFIYDESVANQINVTVTGTVISNLVWRGSPASGVWDLNTTANWNANTLTFFNSDPVTLDDTAGTNIVTLTGTLRPSSVTVSNSSVYYILQGGGKITGLTGLTKTGPGTLVVSNTASDYSGQVVVSGGTLCVNAVANSGTASELGAGSSITLDGGTFQFTGPRPNASSFNRTWIMGTNGGTVLSTNGVFFFQNQISGPGSLTKIGAVQVILGDINTGVLSTGASNSYLGNTYVSEGELQIRNANALGQGKAVVANNGADLSVGGGVDYGIFTNNIDLLGGDGKSSSGALEVNDPSTVANFSGTISLLADSSVGCFTAPSGFIISGPIVGPGMLTKQNHVACTVTLTCPTNTYTGGTTIVGGTLQLGTGGTAGTLGTGNVTNNGTVAYNHSDTTTNGSAISGTGNLTHTGAGTLVLNGTNSYTGATAVNGGTVAVNGVLGANNVTVANGATLSGYGVIGGAVTVNSGGTLSLGTAVGTLTIASNLTLSGTTVMKIAKAGVVLANDLIQGVTTQSFGGTLTITLVSGSDPLAAGDTFQLVNAANYKAAFATVNPPTLSGNLVWDLTKLATQGQISVGAKPVITAPFIGQTVECGGSATFAVSANGSPTLAYQWSVNSLPVAGATTSSFTTNNVHAAGSIYVISVQVTNSYGSVTTNATLTVQDTAPPVINCPGNISAVTTDPTGTNVSFVVTGSDTCDGNATVFSIPPSGSLFPAGTNTVTAYTYDSSGNTNTCSFQIFVDRAPIVTTNLTVNSVQNQLVTLSLGKLLAVVTDPDGDPLSVIDAGPTSTNGGTVTLTSTNVTYLPVTNYAGADLFNYTVSDGRGGLATNSVFVTVASSSGLSPNVVYGPIISNGVFIVRFAGIPGYTYTIEATDDIGTPAWTKKANVTAPTTDEGLGVGIFEFSESVGTATSRFYRTVYPSY